MLKDRRKRSKEYGKSKFDLKEEVKLQPFRRNYKGCFNKSMS